MQIVEIEDRYIQNDVQYTYINRKPSIDIICMGIALAHPNYSCKRGGEPGQLCSHTDTDDAFNVCYDSRTVILKRVHDRTLAANPLLLSENHEHDISIH